MIITIAIGSASIYSSEGRELIGGNEFFLLVEGIGGNSPSLYKNVWGLTANWLHGILKAISRNFTLLRSVNFKISQNFSKFPWDPPIGFSCKHTVCILSNPITESQGNFEVHRP